ncbi:transcriptional regulator [Sporosarcina sp. P37]|uniref:DUF2087 domain-containing protein n=1 Tax=unclassified Sporosarcina TaxID=2647733 RepID=UPI0009BEFC57|nr:MULTISPECIES: DUF2087 domain-containing protein [unclassified Sporosarcina]ARD46890.1 transcriptional regulator [Sporosarcina sp. P33]ARK23415.1 transcriptional regulator [Sporosarcina sp. P37]PID18625.1 DUF2087 domain-containing protein [Sporosarcina sp. P35]
MGHTEAFWEATLIELKQGYTESNNSYDCLLCGKRIEKGVIYPYENTLYEAERFMAVHIEHAHQSVFAYLLELDKKSTGLTGHQGDLLRLFYQGKSDKEVQEELEIGSAATVRHHRFALKEKERQAKVFLAMMELLKERDEYESAFIPPHKAAQLFHDDDQLAEEEQHAILRMFFPEGTDGRLNEMPVTEKQRRVILREISKRFDGDVSYSKHEMNEALSEIHEDFITLRNYLTEYGFFGQTRSGSQYWLK